MLTGSSHNGWNPVTSGLDIEVEHGVPVRISYSHTDRQLGKQLLFKSNRKPAAGAFSTEDWINITPDEQEWSVCIDKTEFSEALRHLALSSAAMYFDRFHKPIDRNNVDWDEAEYSYDFNHAIEHCCIPYGTLNKDYYFDDYINIMHAESLRLCDEGLSSVTN